jgi:dephospho-CoA kinase
MLIIGITGTLGAGKGTIVDYLVKEKGFFHFSVRGFITEEIIRQGLPVNRDSMVMVANKLRADHSPSYIIDQLYEQALLTGKNCIIESIRTPGEVQSLVEKGNFILFAVDADPMLRYDRIVMRNSETDRISFVTFVENEEREMQSNDPNKQNIGKCIEQADFIFLNNSTVTDLYKHLEAELITLNL